MPIPEVPLSCCCDWGEDEIGSGGVLYWYMAQGNVGALTERLEKSVRSNADTVQFSAFTNAALVQAMGELSGTLYFYSYGGVAAVKKYDFDGNLQWTYSVGAGIVNSQPGGFSNSTHRLNVDASGNVYLVATTSASPRKLVAEKIDSSGSQVWTQQISHHGGSGDYWGLFIASDTSGNVAAVGTGGITYFNSSGTQQWGVNAFGHKLCFDASGNVYILRNTSPPSVWCYDNTGAFVFSVSLTGSSTTFFTDMEIFNSKLYTAWYNSTSSKVFLQCRSDSTFSTVDWAIEIPYTNTMIVSPNFAAPRITVDELGDLYATYGTIDGLSNRFGFLTRRLASDGSEVWSDTRTGECLVPMIPPGRPPIFF